MSFTRHAEPLAAAAARLRQVLTPAYLVALAAAAPAALVRPDRRRVVCLWVPVVLLPALVLPIAHAVARAAGPAYAGEMLRPLALAALALLAACSPDGGGAKTGPGGAQPTVPVTVAPAVRKDAPVTLQAIGNVQAYSTVSLKAQVEGRLSKVHFAEGQEVQEGDLLFMLDPSPFEAALRQAQANVARDRAQAENAAVQAQRFTSLAREGVVSRDEYDHARTQAAALAAAAKADEAAVERARIELAYCYISAPRRGRIGQILVHEGNVVKANETVLAVINQLRPIYVEFSVPQQELAQLRRYLAAGPLPVEVTVPTGRLPPVAGQLRFVNNAVDTVTGTVLLKAAFENAHEELWPGQFVNVAVRLTTHPGAILVPAQAVQLGQEGTYVFVVLEDGTVASRPVVTGTTVGADVVVEKGLEPGERVVTQGQVRLAPGVRVEVKQGAGA